ncbi:uncharacterized membrane protein YjjP (DUF1212 family) [Paenibacillus amylolyticus]|uniref:Uncharacterized membrane protein YjjP (DUF1212 family) n=1 Tax=Paenibacillus amylolyticus TaxID=1451 RepID=A0AAP5GY33_PAEAM|nr:uncharacterized membrane protein YjjP (DUF1212 family) [Paenibacillus amylolyticus]
MEIGSNTNEALYGSKVVAFVPFILLLCAV